MLNRLFFALLCTTMSIVSHAEILAKSVGYYRTVTVQTEGHEDDKECWLWVQTDGRGGTRTTSIKHDLFLCSIFGPIAIDVFEIGRSGDELIALRFSRGGDGDHTGRLLTLFRATEKGVREFATTELYDVSFIMLNDELLSISGRKVFCIGPIQCDGSTDDKMSVSVPVDVTIGCQNICIAPSKTKLVKKELYKRAEQAKAYALAAVGDDQKDMLSIERDLAAFFAFLGKLD